MGKFYRIKLVNDTCLICESYALSKSGDGVLFNLTMNNFHVTSTADDFKEYCFNQNNNTISSRPIPIPYLVTQQVVVSELNDFGFWIDRIVSFEFNDDSESRAKACLSNIADAKLWLNGPGHTTQAVSVLDCGTYALFSKADAFTYSNYSLSMATSNMEDYNRENKVSKTKTRKLFKW